MAESFSHKWGQIIGDLIELVIKDFLDRIAKENKLYLDYKHPRKARAGLKVTWMDRYGNKHDLDYVLERGGTEAALGLPAAFIEIAWRRYTKHSRNKAQEIEGAIIPLSQTYDHLHPFLGIVVAGDFTTSSLTQLRSKGFTVLHLPYQKVVDAFATVGIDASFTEVTEEKKFEAKISKWGRLTAKDVAKIKLKLVESEKNHIDHFFQELLNSLSRKVLSVTVIALHGEPLNILSVQKAIEYIQNYKDLEICSKSVLKYEIDIKYNNGDIIHAIFQNKTEAIKFLKSFI